MVKVGVVGIGSMGATHLDAYGRLKGARVVAVADLIEDRREGRFVVSGNVKGQAQGGADFRAFRKYADGLDLIADPDLDLVDICLPTPLHARYAAAALAAGKHVLVEKPFARTAREAHALVRAAGRDGKGPFLMCALCMRFWPAWAWLKDAVGRKTYGKVLAASFYRVTSHPGRSFYNDVAASCGALLDLHIHDTDFVQYCFGMPEAVFSRGYSGPTSEIDHVTTQYLYPDLPLVTAEGGWTLAAGYGFTMRYTVNFEHATAVFELGADEPLRLIRKGVSRPVRVREGMGYQHEIAYFVRCIRRGTSPVQAAAASAAASVRLPEAEARSVRTGRVVRVAS